MGCSPGFLGEYNNAVKSQQSANPYEEREIDVLDFPFLILLPEGKIVKIQRRGSVTALRRFCNVQKKAKLT